jgi:hypothetical protein
MMRFVLRSQCADTSGCPPHGADSGFSLAPGACAFCTINTQLSKLTSLGGDDEAEDVLGALQEVHTLGWQANAKFVVLVCDAPGHGSDLHDSSVSDRCDPLHPPVKSTPRPASRPPSIPEAALRLLGVTLEMNVVMVAPLGSWC